MSVSVSVTVKKREKDRRNELNHRRGHSTSTQAMNGTISITNMANLLRLGLLHSVKDVGKEGVCRETVCDRKHNTTCLGESGNLEYVCMFGSQNVRNGVKTCMYMCKWKLSHDMT